MYELNAEVLIGSQSSRGQAASLNHPRQGECTYWNEQNSQSRVSNGLTRGDLQPLVISQGVPIAK